MNNTALHLTLRELRKNILTPRFFGGVALVGLVLGLSGPFQTFEMLEPVPRVIYWTAICLLTYLAGWFVGAFTTRLIESKTKNKFFQILVSGIAAGLAVWPVVIGINFIAFGGIDTENLPAGTLLIYCVLIAILVTAAPELGFHKISKQKNAFTSAPKIVSRLPLNLRGLLISLSVQDHYVEVSTSNGKGLVHFRLLDAIDDCDGVDGLQIHRSHWVAIAGIKSIFRRDGKVFVETIMGDLLPVSRTYLPEVKKLGLL